MKSPPIFIRSSTSTSCWPVFSSLSSFTVTSHAAKGFTEKLGKLYGILFFRTNTDNNGDLNGVPVINHDQEKMLSIYMKRAETFKRSISSPFELNSKVSELRAHTNFGSFYLRLGTICE